jgi:hypothetical protein
VQAGTSAEIEWTWEPQAELMIIVGFAGVGSVNKPEGYFFLMKDVPDQDSPSLEGLKRVAPRRASLAP